MKIVRCGVRAKLTAEDRKSERVKCFRCLCLQDMTLGIFSIFIF